MSRGDLSEKQREILEYMKEQCLQKGYPPSVREICQAVSLSSTSSVHAHLNTLEKCGYIRRDPMHNRAIEILDESFQTVRTDTASIPIVGQIAAGQPILAEQNIEDYFPIGENYMPKTSSKLFILEVKGDSMINAGIFSKDLLLCESQNTAKNGDIVVALIDDSATVKRFYKENGHYRLQPENDTMEPIIVEEVEILGIVRSLFRPTVI